MSARGAARTQPGPAAARLPVRSARIALDHLAALTAQARRLAARWDEQSLLAREEADRTLQGVRAELERIEPDLQRLRARQQEIVRDLRSRLTEAREH